jgi:hypothetical protein
MARWAEAMSKAISVGWTSRAKRTPTSSKASRMGVQRRAKSSKPACQYCLEVGGKA